jgi:hypothetical protein
MIVNLFRLKSAKQASIFPKCASASFAATTDCGYLNENTVEDDGALFHLTNFHLTNGSDEWTCRRGSIGLPARRRATMLMIASRTAAAAPVFLAVALALPQAATRAQNVEGQPISGPPTTPERLVAEEPRNAFKQLVPGLLVHTRYVAEGRPAVEIWDLMVGPGRKSEKARLPGAAVLEVRSGRGMLRAAKPIELRIGASQALAEGEDFSIVNTDPEAPLILRATVIPPAR